MRKSKFVSEIITDIKNNPNNWKDFEGNGLTKDGIIIKYFTSIPLLSEIELYINNVNTPITWIDKYLLEKVISCWYRTVSLDKLLK